MNDWDAWEFVFGQWVGEGGGVPGQGTAIFTFYSDLQKKVLAIRFEIAPPGQPENFALYTEGTARRK